MAAKVQIGDSGSGRTAKVDDQHALHVTGSTWPPLSDRHSEVKSLVFSQMLTTNGEADGTSSMLVDGSGTPIDFYCTAGLESDIYITTISFMVVDASAGLNTFGNITALANGCQLFYDYAGGTRYIHDAIKTNWDLVRMCLGTPAVGQGDDTFRATKVIGNSEGYIPFLDLTRFGLPYGIRLDRGKNQRMVFRIRDDIRGLDGMDVRVYGMERLV
jgi:hypothetical protein